LAEIPLRAFNKAGFAATLLLAAAVWLCHPAAGLCAAVEEGLSEQELNYIQSVKERENAVIVREKSLEQRQRDLETLEKEIDGKLVELTQLQAEIQERLSELKSIKDKRFKNLIDIYSSMSASKVAPLLDEMDPRTVAEIFRVMKPEAVVKIMPKLDKEKAVAISNEMGLLDLATRSNTTGEKSSAAPSPRGQ